MRNEYIEDLEGEIWIINNGYEISNKGRIITKHGKLSKAKIKENEYVSANVTFEDGFIARSVQRAVAYAFIHNDDPISKIEVNHIDGIKHHNWVENLEWCTKKENQEHEVRVIQKRNGDKNCRSRLTNEQAIEVYYLCKEGEMLYKDIAKMYNIFPPEVSRIVLGTNWTCLGLPPLPPLVRGSRGKGRYKIDCNKLKSITDEGNKKLSDIAKGHDIEMKYLTRLCQEIESKTTYTYSEAIELVACDLFCRLDINQIILKYGLDKDLI